MALISIEDFIELYIKIHQRGLGYIFSKFSFSSRKRTKTTFDDPELETAHWWIIPAVQRRWNELITGSQNISYEEYFLEKYLNQEARRYTMLSVGCGTGSHEFIFAQHPSIKQIQAFDIIPRLIKEAIQIVYKKKLQDKMRFFVADYTKTQFPSESFDIILFNSSLHHFSNLEKTASLTKNILKPNGFLIINEYVGPNRFQWEKNQVKIINDTLKMVIPKEYRRIFKTNLYKSKVRTPGLLRMILNDPSEAPASKKIILTVEKHFKQLEKKEYGGNILMPLLKDISHHFIDENNRTKEILQSLFDLEDAFIKKNSSDYVFGVYQKL